MRAHSHLLLGAGSWVAFTQFHGIPLEAQALGIALAGSLLPDIDHPKSFLGRRLWFISVPLSKLIGHRGLTHSLLALLGGGWLLYHGTAMEHALIAALGIGYVSHLLGDWLTPAGIPLLWPLKKRFSAPLTFRTGGLMEGILDMAMMVGLLLWGWQALPGIDG